MLKILVILKDKTYHNLNPVLHLFSKSQNSHICWHGLATKMEVYFKSLLQRTWSICLTQDVENITGMSQPF